MKSTKRKRPPDDPERERPSGTWRPVNQRLRDAISQLRVLLFIHVEDERVCLRLRDFLYFNRWSVSWLALRQSIHARKRSLSMLVEDLTECLPENKDDELDSLKTTRVLSALLAHVLYGDFEEYRPLLEKLLKKSQLEMDRILGEEYTRELSSGTSLQALPNFKSWFTVRTREPQVKIDRSLSDLNEFQHVQDWNVDQDLHDAKRDAFARKVTRKVDMTAVKSRLKNLKTERKKTTWRPSEERAFDKVIQDVKEEGAVLKVEEKLMLLRTRKYRLFPTKEQEKTLKRYMGTCRWTYNQAVAHFRKTNEYNAMKLRDLYVTKTSKTKREYPEGMGPPPEWAFETPKNLRYNTMRTFQTNVTSAFANKKGGNINKFKIRFLSKKQSPFFTMSEDGKDATIKKTKSAYFLSISCLKDIRAKMDSHVNLKNEIDILNSNGFWYVAIPEYVQPSEYENRGKCIALDPGIKAFMTGMDLEGNVIEFGRDTKTHLNKLRARRNEAQRVMSTFKNQSKKSTHWQYRTYARAKRTFLSCTAKMKNCVKELHYQTSAYLTKHYDAILLPIFQTKDMVKKSSTRNNRFNEGMLSLNHYQFRELLKAKCEVQGKSLVVCSEMYTSKTCGRCSRLHLKLGSNDVFSCHHCEYKAGRDENAAFNILRFVSAGSLQIYP